MNKILRVNKAFCIGIGNLGTVVACVNEKLPVNQRSQMNLWKELEKHSSIVHKNQQLVEAVDLEYHNKMCGRFCDDV
ncbi:hypothetical protein C0J52_13688 [Blattella germanica]|nr:hypothetical protein C0J52_13688 [Blattella germanica]